MVGTLSPSVDDGGPSAAVRRHLWMVPLAVAAFLSLGYAASEQGAYYAGFFVPVVPLVCVLCAARNMDGPRKSLYGIAVATAVLTVRNVTVRLADDQSVAASAANLATVVAYLVLSISLITLSLRSSRGQRVPVNVEALIDTGLIVLGLAGCMLTLFTLPAFQAANMSFVHAFSITVFPVMDLAVAAAVIYVALVIPRGVPSRLLLVMCVVMLFLFDLLRADAARQGLTVTPHAANIPLVLAYGFLGAFALHPSMRTFGASNLHTPQPWSPFRLVVLSAGLLTPILLIAISPSFAPPYLAILIVVNVLSTALLMVRSVRAVRAYSEVHSALRVQAERDALTGLANRPAFRAHVAETLSIADHSGRTVSVIYLDLDGFKQVNDTFGHSAGDALLIEVGQRMQVALRADDFPTRLGGDEFALVCLDDDAGTVGERLAERMLQVFSIPFGLSGHHSQCRAAIGLANTADLPLVNGETLVDAADDAMYQAKRAGSLTWVRHNGRVDDRPRRMPQRGASMPAARTVTAAAGSIDTSRDEAVAPTPHGS